MGTCCWPTLYGGPSYEGMEGGVESSPKSKGGSIRKSPTPGSASQSSELGKLRSRIPSRPQNPAPPYQTPPVASILIQIQALRGRLRRQLIKRTPPSDFGPVLRRPPSPCGPGKHKWGGGAQGFQLVMAAVAKVFTDALTHQDKRIRTMRATRDTSSSPTPPSITRRLAQHMCVCVRPMARLLAEPRCTPRLNQLH